MGWIVGWRRGRRLYKSYYDEELARSGGDVKEPEEITLEETVEETVRKALMNRWQGQITKL